MRDLAVVRAERSSDEDVAIWTYTAIPGRLGVGDGCLIDQLPEPNCSASRDGKSGLAVLPAGTPLVDGPVDRPKSGRSAGVMRPEP